MNSTVIPRELRERRQWLCWRDENGRKVPYDPKFSRRASTNKPTTWASYEEACAAVEPFAYTGIGYVFTADDLFTGIDLDDCIDEGGVIEERALAIVQSMDSYSEISPSGRGIKIWVKGTIPRSVKTQHIELYNRGRYFTVTGHHLPDTPKTIRTVNSELDELYCTLRPGPVHHPQASTTKPQGGDTDERRWALAAMAREQKKMLTTCEGERHHQRYRSAYALGGLIPHISEGEIIAALSVNFGSDKAGAMQTIRDGIRDGRARPRAVPARQSSLNGLIAQNDADGFDPSPAMQPVEPASWELPVPFQTSVLPSFPTDAFPSWLRQMVEAEARATQTPLDLSGMLALAVCATACAGKVKVQVMAGYAEPVNLFVVVALPPANRKSSVFSSLVAPLEAFEEAEAERMKPIIVEAEAKRTIKEATFKRAQDNAAKATSEQRGAKTEEASQLARELIEAPLPVSPRLIVDDASPEVLARLLRDHNGRIAVLSPEGEIFELMAGRYAKNGAPNLGVFLKGHAGDSIRVDRVGRPAEHVRAPALTLGLAVQPEVIRGLAQKPGFRGRGLLGRFLYAMPDSFLGYRAIEPPAVPSYLRTGYNQRITALLRLPDDMTDSQERSGHTLLFDADARQSLRAFQACIEPQLGEFGELGSMTDWGGKLVGAVVRIAGLLHMAKHASIALPWQHAIDTETIEAGIRIGKYLIEHARAAYMEMGADPEVEDAQYVLRWIERSDITTFTKRDVFEGTKGRFKRVEAMEPALRLLIEHSFIRERPQAPRTAPGRPSKIYDVNPL